MSNAPLNAWYPLTWSCNVSRSLSSHRLLGSDIVVYRKEDGAPVALDDMCPHRFAPLSLGKLKDDAIECIYHGMTFGPGGACIRIPGQSVIPANARVPSYTLHEKMGLIWIWPGDADRADPSLIFDLPQYGKPGWHHSEGDALRFNANYLNLADNLCDPAHVNFVHLATLGNSAGEEVAVQHEFREDGISVWRWIKNSPPIPLVAKYGDFKGNVDRWQYYDYVAPCTAVIDFGAADVDAIESPDQRDKGMRMFALHFITPVDDHACIDHWMHVRNFALDDSITDQKLNNDLRVAYNEDKVVLERIDEVERARPHAKKIRLAIDAAPQRMRKIVERMTSVGSRHAAE